MPFELIVALRYLREGRGQTWLILAGIAVGVAVIVFLSSLITGLQGSLIDRTLGTQAHVVVRPSEEMPRVLPAPATGIRDTRIERPAQRVRAISQWQQAVDRVASMPGVTAVAATVAGPAMAVRGAGASAVTVRGIDPPSYDRIVDLRSRIVDGAFDVSSGYALIGTELARDLGLETGDPFRLRADENRGGVYTVSGIFDFDNRDLNARWVFIGIRAAQTMFDLEGGISTIEIRGAKVFEAESLALRIAESTGLEAESWMESNAQLLVALRSQSSSSYLIQVFVVLAVALGIASVLAVSVIQKSREIGILRATGTRAARVSRIFLIQGGLLGIAGAIIGVLLGIGLALFFAGLARNPDGSAIFPVALTPSLYIRTTLIAVAVGVISAVIPARRAARLDPATAIRNA
jgi:lipoprotein-releasing system permease protein